MSEMLATADSGGSPDFDSVRCKYLSQYASKRQRAVISYASAWTQGRPFPDFQLSVNDEDTHALMVVIHGIRSKDLDLFLHTPGGSIDATESFVNYLRSKFDHIRVIVPQSAMSAGTMIACACDEIVMANHSNLGPTDPQFVIQTSLGLRQVAAQNILAQFEMAVEEISKNTSAANAWYSLISQYGPELLVQAKNAVQRSESLVETWLSSYMLNVDPSKAREIAQELTKSSRHLSHGKPLSRSEAKGLGLKIVDMEKDQDYQDAVMAVFHSTMISFTFTKTMKIVENHLGARFIRSSA